MTMSITEAAIYLNETEDNIRLMLMNAYPETFDTLTELSDEQVQLIEQVKGQATQKLHQLSAAAPTETNGHSSNGQASSGELTVKYVEALDTATETERQLIQGVLEVFNADAVKLGVVSGTLRASNFIAADKASFSHAIAQFYQKEHGATEQLMQDFVSGNDVLDQLKAMGIDPHVSLGNAQKVSTAGADNIVNQVLSSLKR
jgi:Tfp pilus assembly protein PilP